MSKSKKRHGRALLIAAALLLGSVCARAADPVVPRVWTACKVEIELFCNQISPGNGRIIACLYANEDQLSTPCDYHLLRAAGELQDLMGALNQVAVGCKADIESKCSDQKGNKGGVVQCLKLQQKQLSTECRGAIEATGIDLR